MKHYYYIHYPVYENQWYVFRITEPRDIDEYLDPKTLKWVEYTGVVEQSFNSRRHAIQMLKKAFPKVRFRDYTADTNLRDANLQPEFYV